MVGNGQIKYSDKKIAIVQVDSLLGECLQSALKSMLGCQVLGNWTGLVNMYSAGQQVPDVLVISCTALQPAMLQQIALLRQRQTLQVVLTHLPVHRQRDAELRALADGIVLEGASLSRLVAEISGVIEARSTSLPVLKRSRSSIGADVHLTRREQQITLAIKDGLSNKQIARVLNIELSTVKNHVHNIIDKLGVETRWQAVSFAEFNGLIEGNRAAPSVARLA